MKDIYFIFRREFYLVFRDHAVLTFFIFLCLGYPLIYTFIYSNEVKTGARCCHRSVQVSFKP